MVPLDEGHDKLAFALLVAEGVGVDDADELSLDVSQIVLPVEHS